MAKLSPLNDSETAVNLQKRQDIEDCSEKYIAATGSVMLQSNVRDARTAGIKSIMDKDAPHANGVLADIQTKTGKASGVVVVQDLLARRLLKSQTGTDPGSPTEKPDGSPATLAVVPGDVAIYSAKLAALDDAIEALSALTYTVVDVSPAA